MAYYGQKQQAKTAAAVGEYNAKVAEAEALTIDMEARENLRRRRQTNKSFLARQRARFVSSGVVEDTGTPLEVQAETAGLLEMEALDANRVARQQAEQRRAGATYSRLSGQSQAAYYGTMAGASLLAGVGGLAANAYNFKTSGAFGKV